MRLVQFKTPDGRCRIAATLPAASEARVVMGATSVRELALQAHRTSRSFGSLIMEYGLGDAIDIAALEVDGLLLPPLDQFQSTRCTIGITGLTHLGSAASRDAMHAKLKSDDLSDSMRMFKVGVDGATADASGLRR